MEREARVSVVKSGSQLDMRVRRFGLTELNVSEFGLGCARIGGIFKRDPAEFLNLLFAAFDAGINFFDTANIYSQGESETLLGRAFHHRREKVVLASKAGYVLPSRRRVVARLKPLVRPMIGALGLTRQHLPGPVRGSLAQDFSATHLRKAVEASLRRLRTDRLDLFQMHSPPVEVVEADDWIDALETLKRQGKIRYYGVSCDEVDATLAALRHSGVSSIQVPLNLLEREATRALPVASAQGVGVIARECLANGLLVKDVAQRDIRSYCRSDDEAARKAVQLEECRRAADENDCTLPQLALQFVSRLEGVSVSLVGVSSLEQLTTLLTNGLPSAEHPPLRAIPQFA
jgi:aryl-alcohol dehydrogenase-like predicted oxidoreductase